MPRTCGANTTLFLTYLLLLILGFWHHEMWRDELQTWATALYSENFSDLLYNFRYDGHPILWYIVLWAVSKGIPDPVAMQIMHGVFAAGAAALIVFVSPFRFWEKLSLLTGYYLLFEYALICRAYGLGMLLLFSVASLWRRFPQRFVLIAGLLFLIFQTSAFAAVIGLGMTVVYAWEWYQSPQTRFVSIRTLLASCLLAAGPVVAYLTTRTPPDANYLTKPTYGWDVAAIAHVIRSVYTGLFPFPSPKLNFWNSNALTSLFPMALLAIIGVVGSLWFLRTRRVAAVLFGVSISLLVGFVYFVSAHVGSTRHFGHYFLALVVSYWIFLVKTPLAERRPSPLIGGIFFVQMAAGWFAYVVDASYPFSMARDTAYYLSSNYPDSTRLVGDYNYLMTPIANYARRDVYALSTQRAGLYVLWNKANWDPVFLPPRQTDSVLLARYVRFQTEYPTSVLIVSTALARQNYFRLSAGQTYLHPLASGRYEITCMARFDGAIVADENYAIYRVRKLK